MRLPAKALLVVLGALTVSHLLAVYAESQAAAQTSWILVSLAVVLGVVALLDAILRRLRGVVGS